MTEESPWMKLREYRLRGEGSLVQPRERPSSLLDASLLLCRPLVGPGTPETVIDIDYKVSPGSFLGQGP